MPELDPHAEPHPDAAGYVLGVLEPDEEAAFGAHLVGCDACRREVEALSGLPGLLDRAAPPVELPPDLRARTLAAVDRAAGDHGVSASLDADDQTGDGQSAPVLAMAPRRRWRPLGSWSPLAAAAAVLAIVIAATVVLQGTGQQPALAEFTLVAAEGGPGRGRAEVRRADEGLEVDLEVEGLPPSPPGTYYECWFVGEGDTLEQQNRVSAGSFRVGPDGRARVRMVAAADLARFPKMGVTREPDDGDPRRTGDKFLVSR